jgi:hypothetical protein
MSDQHRRPERPPRHPERSEGSAVPSDHSDRIDLSALDPTKDAARFSALSATIARDAMAARARRAATPDLLAELGRWSLPALIAAAIVLAVSLPPLVRTPATASARTIASATDVLGIPQPLVDLMRSPRTPSLWQIDAALSGVDRR